MRVPAPADIRFFFPFSAFRACVNDSDSFFLFPPFVIANKFEMEKEREIWREGTGRKGEKKRSHDGVMRGAEGHLFREQVYGWAWIYG